MKNTDFEEIYKKYHKNLLVYALSLCGDYDLAQSLVQAPSPRPTFPIRKVAV